MLSLWEKESFLNFDFLIIGGGILGLSTACELKERHPGFSIAVLEKGIIPTGASTKNAGFACFGSLTEILSDKKRIGESAAVELVRMRWEGIGLLRKRLSDEQTGFLNFGGYELIDSNHLDSLKMIGHVNKMLSDIFGADFFEIKNDKITEFGFNADQVKALVFSQFESQIDTGRMMSSLTDHAASMGIRLVTGCEVSHISEKENHIKIETNNFSGSERISFKGKCAIVCTNAFTKKLLPQINIVPGRGQVIVTKPIDDLKIKGVFHYNEGYYYFRNFNNRIIFGGGRNLDITGEQTTDFDANSRILNDLKEKLDKIILPSHEYEIDYFWTGIMGFNKTKVPEIKRLSDRITFAISCNGMGIALSSYIAKELANIYIH